jgi:MFS family permease
VTELQVCPIVIRLAHSLGRYQRANMSAPRKLPAGTARLYSLCALLALGASIWGFDIGIWSSIMVHPGWRKAMREPDASDRGALTAVYYIGTLLSYLLVSHPLADRLGRRYAALTGTVVLSAGAVIMGAASSVGIMAIGRWICGIGVAITSTTVPLYQR